MTLLQADPIVLQTCRSLLVRLGHRLQASCGFTMREIFGDAATPFSVVEQGALLNVHPATTLGTTDGPCASGRNSVMDLS